MPAFTETITMSLNKVSLICCVVRTFFSNYPNQLINRCSIRRDAYIRQLRHNVATIESATMFWLSPNVSFYGCSSNLMYLNQIDQSALTRYSTKGALDWSPML